MMETERITNQIMTDYGFDATGTYHAPEYPHANILGEGLDLRSNACTAQVFELPFESILEVRS